MYPPVFSHYYRTLPVVTPNCSLTKFLHHPSESASRSFILLVCFFGMSASEFLSDFVKSGGGAGGCGSHMYIVLCTVWATIGLRCSLLLFIWAT